MGLFTFKKPLLKAEIQYLKKAFFYDIFFHFIMNPYSLNENSTDRERKEWVFGNEIILKKKNDYYITLRNFEDCSLHGEPYLIISDASKETIDFHVLMKGIDKKNMSELEDSYDKVLRQLLTSLYDYPPTTGFYFQKNKIYSSHNWNEFLDNGGYLIKDILEASKDEESLKKFYETNLNNLQEQWQKKSFEVLVQALDTKKFDLLDTELYKYLTLDEFKKLESILKDEIQIENTRKKRFKKRKNMDQSFEENLIEVLNKKSIIKHEIHLIEPNTLCRLQIDNDWSSLLMNESRKERINKTIEHWQKYVPEFHKWIELMKKRLISIDTVKIDDVISIVYSIESDDGMVYYIGGMPQKSYNHIALKHLPKEINNFYIHIHDEYVVYDSDDMGLQKVDKIYCLADDIAQEDFIQGLSVKDCFEILSNGGGDGIIFDISSTPSKCYTFYHDDYALCQFEENPADAICEWMKAQIES